MDCFSTSFLFFHSSFKYPISSSSTFTKLTILRSTVARERKKGAQKFGGGRSKMTKWRNNFRQIRQIFVGSVFFFFFICRNCLAKLTPPPSPRCPKTPIFSPPSFFPPILITPIFRHSTNDYRTTKHRTIFSSNQVFFLFRSLY